MNKDIALIVGVGQATGHALARRWAPHYKLLLVARSADFITKLAAELPDAQALVCDVADRLAWSATLGQIRDEIGLPKRILINTESAAWGEYHELSLEALDTSFDVNAISLLQLVQTLFPTQAAIPPDTRIMISSSPAAYDPPPRFLGLAPSRVAQRVLAELLDANLRRYGLSFSVFSIDGAIDEPKMRAMLPDQPTSYFIQADDIAAKMTAVFASEEFALATGISGASSFGKRKV